MWSRKTVDPLGQLLFEKYGMHVLGRPREDVSVLQVFAFRDEAMFRSGSLDAFLRTRVQKPEVGEHEAQLDIDATMSGAVSARIAFSFLKGFLSFIGVGAVNTVSASFENSKSEALRFRFGGCTRDYVKDGFDLDWKLSEVAFDKEKSSMKEGERYYIATGVHFCNALTFELLDKNSNTVDVEADVVLLGRGKSGLSVGKDQQITAESDKTLAYGVELNELVYDEKRRRLQLQESKGYVHVLAGVAVDMPRAMIGGPDDTMMLPVVD